MAACIVCVVALSSIMSSRGGITKYPLDNSSLVSINRNRARSGKPGPWKRGYDKKHQIHSHHNSMSLISLCFDGSAANSS